MNMRLVLKEKQKLNEDRSRPETYIMYASEFLALTTNQKLYDSIKSNIDRGGYFDGEEYDPEKAGKLQLFIKEDGTVVGHEGRHRSMAAIKSEGPRAMVIVDIALDSPEDLLQGLPQFLIGQYDKSVKIPSNKFVWQDISNENLLNLGIYGTKFRDHKQATAYIKQAFESSALSVDEFDKHFSKAYQMDDERGMPVYLGGDDKGLFLVDDEGNFPQGQVYVKMARKRR